MRIPGWFSKVKASPTVRHRSALQRPSLFLLAGVGLFLLGLLAGIYLFFPSEALRQRIIQEVVSRTGTEVQIEQVSLYPPLALDANRIKLSVIGLPLPLEIEQLSISPQWSTLLSGDPGASLHGRIMNGSWSADLQKSGVVKAEAIGLRFDLPVQQPVPFNITGTLSEAALETSIGLSPKAKSSLTLRLVDVSILGLEIFKADSRGLSLGDISLELDGLGRALRIKALTAQGGDLEVTGDGILQVGRSAATSRIRIVLRVRAGSNADPSIASMLQLAGELGEDGFYSLQLTGTVAKPILKPVD